MNKIGISLATVAAVVILSAMLIGIVTDTWSPVTMIEAWQEKILPEEKPPFETTILVEKEDFFLIGNGFSRIWIKVNDTTPDGIVLTVPNQKHQGRLFVDNSAKNFFIDKQLFTISCEKIAGNETIYIISIKKVL